MDLTAEQWNNARIYVDGNEVGGCINLQDLPAESQVLIVLPDSRRLDFGVAAYRQAQHIVEKATGLPDTESLISGRLIKAPRRAAQPKGDKSDG